MPTQNKSDLAVFAPCLAQILSEATWGNCLEIAQKIVELSRSKELPAVATHRIEMLNFRKQPYAPDDPALHRLQIPLNAVAKERLGIVADELHEFPGWKFHITTELIAELLVDCLTGCDGIGTSSYLEQFFDYSEYLQLTEYDILHGGEPV